MDVLEGHGPNKALVVCYPGSSRGPLILTRACCWKMFERQLTRRGRVEDLSELNALSAKITHIFSTRRHQRWIFGTTLQLGFLCGAANHNLNDQISSVYL